MKLKKTFDVFGVTSDILVDSYVDRGNLDAQLKNLLSRNCHIALRGESKCGKSWLRKKNIPNGLVVQCRLGKGINDIYTDALSQLGIELKIEKTVGSNIKGHLEAQTEIGVKLLAKVQGSAAIEGQTNCENKFSEFGKDINDIRYIADVIKHSNRRLIIEDFHYLSEEERKLFAFDLKALWDYNCPVVVIGVWSQHNLLSYLNPDLTGRISEMSIYWSKNDLHEVINKGSSTLNIKFSNNILNYLTQDCFENVGLLQQLVLLTLDNAKIYEQQNTLTIIDDDDLYVTAARVHAEQLEPVYRQFADAVSKGFHNRENPTGIYAYAMSAIIGSTDEKLLKGLGESEIYDISHSKQPRIQRQNLRTILKKIQELQVDQDGRGLVISYDETQKTMVLVDRQLLFYRKYFLKNWPWDNFIADIENFTEQEQTKILGY